MVNDLSALIILKNITERRAKNCLDSPIVFFCELFRLRIPGEGRVPITGQNSFSVRAPRAENFRVAPAESFGVAEDGRPW